MHTKYTSYQQSGIGEHRLCFLDQQRRHDLVDEAVATKGTMEGATPLNAIEQNSQKLIAEIATIKVNWKEWAWHFFSSQSVIDQKTQDIIMQSAESHIQKESDLAIEGIAGWFNRGKRRLYLASKEKIAEQIRSDLMAHLQAKQREAMEREGRFHRLASALRSTKEPLRLGDSTQKKLLSTLERVGQTMKQEHTTSGREYAIPKEWQRVRETEQMLKQQLLKHDVVDASQLEALLDGNAQGDMRLQTLVESSPQLRTQPELRECLLDAIQRMRTGNARYYRLQKFMEQNGNTGTLEERMQFLQQDPNIVGRNLRLSFGANAPIDTYVVNRGDGFIVMRMGNSQDYCILDTQTKEVTYRDAARVFHDYPLTEHSFSLT